MRLRHSPQYCSRMPYPYASYSVGSGTLARTNASLRSTHVAHLPRSSPLRHMLLYRHYQCDLAMDFQNRKFALPAFLAQAASPLFDEIHDAYEDKHAHYSDSLLYLESDVGLVFDSNCYVVCHTKDFIASYRLCYALPLRSTFLFNPLPDARSRPCHFKSRNRDGSPVSASIFECYFVSCLSP